MSRRHGFTLVEILVCVGIIAIVAAIVFPIGTRVRYSARVTESKSNLRQIWLALEMYRDNYDDAADVGDLYALRLPPTDEYMLQFLPNLGLKPPLAGRWQGMGWYYYFPPDPKYVQPSLAREWLRYSAACHDGAVIVGDLNFSDVDPVVGSPLELRRGIGVSLGGALVDRTKRGSPIVFGWWGCQGGEK